MLAGSTALRVALSRSACRPSARAAVRPSRAQRRAVAAPRAAGDGFPGGEVPEPDNARAAIAAGLRLCQQGDYEQAQELFERALELPGTGVKRFRDKPPAISDGEKIAALYNIACCQSQLGNANNGLIALAGCLEAGYDDFQQVRSDPDLAAVRADERFDGLLTRFERRAGGGGLFGLFKGM